MAVEEPATSYDPDRPLPAPPEPWAPSLMPPLRANPPYLMTQMIDAEPALAQRIVERLTTSGGGAAELATEIRETVQAGGRIVLTGCGTSEHGAMAAALIIRDGLARAGVGGDGRPPEPEVMQAFEASLDPPADALLIAISHEGGTWATNQALAAAREAPIRTAVITAGPGSPAARLSDIVVATGEQDQSWCHTVGYLSPIVAAAAVAGEIAGEPLDGAAVRALLAAGLARAHEAEDLASALADVSQLIVIASGADRPAARELALKIEEASHLPTTMFDLETVLHGHLPATDENTGLVLILTDRHERAARLERSWQALSSAGAIGLRAGAIVSAEVDRDLDSGLTPIGRLVIREAPELPAPLAALIGSAVPLQLLTERLARARGTNPDTMRRDDDRYREAAELHE
jgi:glucosamine--fructose-6-phosphate aminotransferase (isomerizing)